MCVWVGGGGGRGMEVGEEGDLYTYLHWAVTTRMTSAFKMGSSDSHFNVLFIVRNKVTRQCAQTMMNRLNYLGMLISIQAYCNH